MICSRKPLEQFCGILNLREKTLELYVMHCAIWYHLCNFKKVKNTHGRVLLLVKLAKTNTPLWVFFKFFIVQMVSNRAKHFIFLVIFKGLTSRESKWIKVNTTLFLKTWKPIAFWCFQGGIQSTESFQFA